MYNLDLWQFDSTDATQTEFNIYTLTVLFLFLCFVTQLLVGGFNKLSILFFDVYCTSLSKKNSFHIYFYVIMFLTTYISYIMELPEKKDL